MSRPFTREARRSRGPSTARDQALRLEERRRAEAAMAGFRSAVEGLGTERKIRVLRLLVVACAHVLSDLGDAARSQGILAHAQAAVEPAYAPEATRVAEAVFARRAAA